MCGEPAAKEERAPVSSAQSRTLVPVPVSSRASECAVLCAVVSVRAWVLLLCGAPAGCSLARSLVLQRRHRAVASSTRFLSSYIHILCTRGCSILVDQTSNTRGHLRPPPSWWCVRPCAFVSSRLLLTTSPSAALRFPIPSFSVCEHNNGVPVRPSRPIPYPKDTRPRFTS